MGAPIIVPSQQQDPWSQLLPQLFLMKIQHNQAMEVEKLKIERKKAEKQEERTYAEGRDATKAATSKQTQIELENLRTQNDILQKGGYEVSPPQTGTSPQPIGSSQSVPTTSGGSIQKVGNKYMFIPPTKEGEDWLSNDNKLYNAAYNQNNPLAMKVIKQKQADAIAKSEASARITQQSKLEGIDVDALADSAIRGDETVDNIKNAFGIAVSTKVQSAIVKKNPNYNFTKARANMAYRKNPANLRSMGLAIAAYPRVIDLKLKAEALKNYKGNRTANMALNTIKKEFGATEVVDFESLRNAIIQEVNTALSGSSTPSDYRIKIEMENLQRGSTPKQLEASINNLLSALDARVDASMAVPYPWEEVRGEVKFKNARERVDYFMKQTGRKDSTKSSTPDLESMSTEDLLKALEQ